MSRNSRSITLPVGKVGLAVFEVGHLISNQQASLGCYEYLSFYKPQTHFFLECLW
jgi:hypothetical protein